MELDDRVRELEDKAFRFNVEKETMLLVMVYLFDKLMPRNQQVRMAMVSDVEAVIERQFPKLRSGMTPVQTDAYVDEMQAALARMMGVVRDGTGLPRK